MSDQQNAPHAGKPHLTEPQPAAADIEQAAALLDAGELVAFPTETVYGLGGDAASPEAVARIYAAKGRPANHPVIVHLPPGGDPTYWAAEWPEAAQKLAEAFWPGPLTLIVKRHERIPDAVSGGQDSVGLRCPSHPVAQKLLAAFSQRRGGHGGVAAPSANRFGHVSPTTAQHVRDEFGGAVYVLDGGACDVGIESTILDLSRGFPALLRPGHVTPHDIARVLGEAPPCPTARMPRRPARRARSRRITRRARRSRCCRSKRWSRCSRQRAIPAKRWRWWRASRARAHGPSRRACISSPRRKSRRNMRVNSTACCECSIARMFRAF